MQKILVVDDDIDLLRILRFILTNNGYECLAVDNGSDINTHLRQYQPDLAILDINIGTTDGKQLCRNMKDDETTSRIPVILFYADTETKSELEKSGADAFVQKPVSTDTFLATIHSLLPPV